MFSGNMYTQVGECNVQNGHDHLYAQMYPTNTLGKDFIVVPLENRFGGDIIKLLGTKDNTSVTAKSSSYQLDAGEFVKLLSETVMQVSSDKPISVGQYSRTMDCDGTLGDPFLIPISPNEQLLKRITFNAPSIATLSLYSLNIVTKQSEVFNITFDDIPIGDKFNFITDSEYAYARINTVGGNHTIKSNDGFIAYVYGFGHNESFGYATGASLGNLNVDIVINDQNKKTPIDSLCLGSEISFSPLADTIYTLFEYDFGDGQSTITNEDTTVYHTYNKTGEYLVSLKASTGGNDCSNGNEEISSKVIRTIEPFAEILGPRSVCPNTSGVAYFINAAESNNYSWFLKGGSFSEQNMDTVLVDWGETNNNAKVELLATNRYGCISDTINHPVKINFQLDPEAPFGPVTLCSNNILDIPYNAYFTHASTYQWETDFGTVSSGDGTNEIKMNWASYGEGKIWFSQISITDTICDGVSDTLFVNIQRNPSEIGTIETEKDTVLIGQSISFGLVVDSLYKFANWTISDGTSIDTSDITVSQAHIFNCEGNYTVSVLAFDTGSVCSDTKAIIEKEIFVKPVEIINVSESSSQSEALDIIWKIGNEQFYQKPLLLYRRVYGEEGWQLIAELEPGVTKFTDTNVNVHDQSYEYKFETNQDCASTVSAIHRSILLSSSKGDENSSLLWNDYDEWDNGVMQYEVWLSIDSNEYKLIEATSDKSKIYEYRHDGFNFCYYIKAIESSGNSSFSISNTSCLNFIPKIKTYNIITPNTDEFNEYFTIDNNEHYPNSKLTILNRYGKVVYASTGYGNNWNGKISGETAPSGTYYYELELDEPRNELKSIRGYFSILY